VSPKIVDKQAKKYEILTAAMRVFAQKGVVQTRMSDIAEAAGIGKGTIYEYFRSKEDIFAETYRQVFEGTEQQVMAIISADLDPETKLRKLMTTTVDGFLGDGGEFAGIMMAFWSEAVRNKDDRIIDIINLQQIYADYRRMISAILDEGVLTGAFQVSDTFMTASVLIGAMDGILLQCIMDPDIFTPTQAVEALLESYLNGIKK